MFQACEYFRNSCYLSYLILASNVGIKIRVKLNNCISKYFQGIVFRVRNNFNWSTIQFQIFKPIFNQIIWILHSSSKRHPRSISTLQLIDLALQSLSWNYESVFGSTFLILEAQDVSRFPHYNLQHMNIAAEVHSHCWVFWDWASRQWSCFHWNLLHWNVISQDNTHLHLHHYLYYWFSLYGQE